MRAMRIVVAVIFSPGLIMSGVLMLLMSMSILIHHREKTSGRPLLVTIPLIFLISAASFAGAVYLLDRALMP